jgi:septum site-determining protein MinC
VLFCGTDLKYLFKERSSLSAEIKGSAQEPWLKRVRRPKEIDEMVDDNTILVRRTLRSGQKIHFNGNVVVVGDVNPGAEIIASGHIIVLGALRGVVHAGALGNEQAAVLAFKLQPTQLRIASHITRPPEDDFTGPEQPEIARIKDNTVTIEVFQSSNNRHGNLI